MMFKRIEPQDGQESVWDYPRPPRLEVSSKRIRIFFNEVLLVDTTHALRVLETSHPPSYYIPQADIRMAYLTKTNRKTVCEFKGQASYWSIQVGDKKVTDAGWCYESPSSGYEPIAGYIAFYPSKMDACFVDDEQVVAQEGDFYGGWITRDIVGPFKGGAGTWGW
jgi:uncharacterized protein (DUF427 family)